MAAYRHWPAVVLVLVGVVVALALYRPWQSDPLPLRDFAGAIWLLSPTSGVSEAYQALMDEHTREGRFQPAFMIGFATQWSMFGTNSVGWQVVRFVLMATVMVLGIVLAVRCGATSAAAATAMAMWLVISNSHEAWILLQIAEPFAALCVAIAAILGTLWRTSPRPLLVGCGIAIALLAAILSKETMIVALPFVVGLALCRDAGQWSMPQLSRRSTGLVLLVTVVIGVFAVIPIFKTRLSAAAGAYASRFELSQVGIDSLSNSASAILLPVTRVPWFPANALFIVILLVGWTLMMRRDPRRATIAAGVLLVFPVAGTLLYAAWPAFPGYYAMPFALSIGTMLALALTTLIRRSRVMGLGACVLMGVVTLYGTVLAWNGAQVDRAIRRTDWAGVQMVAALPVGARLIAAVPDPATSGSVSRSLSLYAATAGAAHALPSTEDVACDDAHPTRSDTGTVAIILFSNLCGTAVTPDQPPTGRMTARYVEIDWKTFRPRTVENTVSLWLARAHLN